MNQPIELNKSRHEQTLDYIGKNAPGGKVKVEGLQQGHSIPTATEPLCELAVLLMVPELGEGTGVRGGETSPVPSETWEGIKMLTRLRQIPTHSTFSCY